MGAVRSVCAVCAQCVRAVSRTLYYTAHHRTSRQEAACPLVAGRLPGLPSHNANGG
jgi:hypothetical protein